MEKFEKMAADAGLHYQSYPKTRLINVTDKFEVIQSFYTTTGTAVFRDSNNKYKQQRKTVRDMDYAEFIRLCSNPDEILDNYLLKEE